jgi:hypothetical protein
MAPASDDHRQGFQSLGDLGIGKQFNLRIAVAVLPGVLAFFAGRRDTSPPDLYSGFRLSISGVLQEFALLRGRLR